MAEDLGNLIGWGLIGTPDGMECKSGGCIEKFDIRRIVDLDNRYIEILPGSQILSLFREIRNGQPVYYYLLYRYAREIRSARPGSFYGSVFVVVSHTLDAEIAWSVLCQLSNYLETFLDEDKRFKTSISQVSLPEPVEIKTLKGRLQPALHSGSETSASCFLPVSPICSGAEFFNEAVQLLSSGSFNRVYGSASIEIILRVKTRKTLTYIHKNAISKLMKIEELNRELQQMQGRHKEQLIHLKGMEEELRKEIKKSAHTLEQVRHENIHLQKEAAHKLDLARLENLRLQKKLNARAGRVVNRISTNPQAAWVRRLQKFSFSRMAAFPVIALASLLLLVYLGIKILPSFRHPAVQVLDSTHGNLPLKPVKFRELKPDLQLQKFTMMYCEDMKIYANQYQADTVNKLLSRLKQAGMENDSSYRKLFALSNNYGLTGLAFSKLKVHRYRVNDGDYSGQIVLKHLKRSNPRLKLFSWFDTSFLRINDLQADSKLQKGRELIFLLPVD